VFSRVGRDLVKRRARVMWAEGRESKSRKWRRVQRRKRDWCRGMGPWRVGWTRRRPGRFGVVMVGAVGENLGVVHKMVSITCRAYRVNI
jgi:hypothetical protein